MSARERVAVIGAGVSGLTAAYLLRQRHEVTVFEARSVLGGHADTHDVPTPDGAVVPVDTGFIVYNEHTYPYLTRLFAELGVTTQRSDMSMSVRCAQCGLEYAGGRRGRGLLPAGDQRVWPRYARMLAEIPRLHRAARDLIDGPAPDDVTLGDFLRAGGYSRYLVDHYALPLVAAVWSGGEQTSLSYPAAHLFTFLDNHGMLRARPDLRWRTVTGGSRRYVELIAKRLATVRPATTVRAVRRHPDGVEIVDAAGVTHDVDRVVLATHADQALGLLADPTNDEKEVLGAFTYTRNKMCLHVDDTLLPRRARTQASWNYLKSACGGGEQVVMSYHMNRLMQLCEPLDYLVTLNGRARVDDAAVIATGSYEHPVFTPATRAAQRRLPDLTDPRTAYAGAYHGWGFHEDGCVSGVRAAAAFSVRW